MGRKVNLLTSIHKSTKRNYLERMMDNKPYYMNLAQKYGKEYWDGNRKCGYGGYKYIEGYWTPLAKKIIKNYKLKNESKILDIGCGKAFLLFEIKKILPGIKIYGYDVSKYAIKNSPKIIRSGLIYKNAGSRSNYKKNFFDLVISLGCIHNLEIDKLFICLREIERIGKKKFIMTESYRNNKELFNLQCWALTCKSFFNTNEWKWIFKTTKYTGDYEFIFFE